MGLTDRLKNREVPQKQTEELPKKEIKEVKESTMKQTTSLKLTKDELEFLIRLIGDSNFKGNNLMFIYELVKKLQEEYLTQSGGK